MNMYRLRSLSTVGWTFLAVVVLGMVGYEAIWKWMICRI